MKVMIYYSHYFLDEKIKKLQTIRSSYLKAKMKMNPFVNNLLGYVSMMAIY